MKKLPLFLACIKALSKRKNINKWQMGTLGTCIPSVGFPISKLPILEYLIINKILKSINDVLLGRSMYKEGPTK